MSDTPAPPPTSQWTVTDDGDIDNSDGWYLRMYRYTGMSVGEASREDKECVAAALNGGPEVEALRSVEPTAAEVYEHMRTSGGYETMDMADVFTVVRAYGKIRAALVREQTEGTTT